MNPRLEVRTLQPLDRTPVVVERAPFHELGHILDRQKGNVYIIEPVKNQVRLRTELVAAWASSLRADVVCA